MQDGPFPSGDAMLTLVGDWTDTCRDVLVRGPEDIGDRLVDAFGACPQEALVALVLGPDQRVRECALVALGRGNEARARPVDVFRRPLLLGGRALVLAHNHPSGRTVPSSDDLVFTERLLEAGHLLGLEVVDHLILVRRSWRSLRESTNLWRPRTAKAVQPVPAMPLDP